NTNGIRIANDEGFARRLSSYCPGFEVYLQFDSLESAPIEVLRGEDLLGIRHKALEHLNRYNISTTLVVTLRKGLNDHEMGKIIEFALKQPCVRGVTFQPIQVAGRTENFDPATDRLTLGEVRQKILAQSSVFTPEDIIPVPCHPDCIAMAYALKVQDQVVPLSGVLDPQVFLKDGKNTIRYEEDPAVRKELFKLFALNHSPESTSHATYNLLCCLPEIQSGLDLGYENIFRVIIMEFLDPYNFDVRSVKRSCIHIVHPDGRIIPFDTYNIFYRNNEAFVENQPLLSQRFSGVSSVT
ncbi:MAG: radical SAM protein, partial [Cyanobacteria bacterium]|nr:radical SAM protein [Cyanobacteriota bacterium]